MWLSTAAALKQHLEIEIAEAEAVILQASDSNKTAHEPTISYFRGQADAAKKLLAVVNDVPLGIWLSPASIIIIVVGAIFVWLLH